MKMHYRELDLVDTKCEACQMALGLSTNPIGYVDDQRRSHVWHFDCAPSFLQQAHLKALEIVDG